MLEGFKSVTFLGLYMPYDRGQLCLQHVDNLEAVLLLIVSLLILCSGLHISLLRDQGFLLDCMFIFAFDIRDLLDIIDPGLL